MAGLPGGTGARGSEAAPSPLALFLIARKSHATRAAWLVGTLAAATLLTVLRVQLGLGSTTVPLVFYLPAVIAVTLVAGWEYGAAALVLSIGIVDYAFLPPHFGFGLLPRAQAVTLTLWTFVSGLMVALAHFLRVSLAQAVRNEARYRRLMSVISDVVWTTDRDGNTLVPNPGWARVSGQAWPQYSGRKWIEAVHEEDRAALRPNAQTGTHLADFRLKGTGDWRWYRARAVAVEGPDGEIEEWITAIRDVHESKLARERDELMVGEARHRLKNLVAIIEALAKYSRDRAAPPNAELEAYLMRFLGRLHALGAAADLVVAGQHQHVEIGALARVTLAPFLEEKAGRFEIEGPAVMVSEATGGSLAMAIHELATNALKYGALTQPNGRVAIRWSSEPAGNGERVIITWKEHGGPRPHAPEREGFGSRMIKSVPVREKDGKVTMEFEPDGLSCRIAFVQSPKSAEAR